MNEKENLEALERGVPTAPITWICRTLGGSHLVIDYHGSGWLSIIVFPTGEPLGSGTKIAWFNPDVQAKHWQDFCEKSDHHEELRMKFERRLRIQEPGEGTPGDIQGTPGDIQGTPGDIQGTNKGTVVALQAQLDDVYEALGDDLLPVYDGYAGDAIKALWRAFLYCAELERDEVGVIETIVSINAND